MAGTIKIRRTKVKLNFLDDKPVVNKVQKLTMPMIKGDDLVAYIAKSANVPKSSVKSAVAAIAQAIAYFVINGHSVHFDDFGTFQLKYQFKTQETEDAVSTKNIKRLVPRFIAHQKLLEQLASINFETYETVSIPVDDGGEG